MEHERAIPPERDTDGNFFVGVVVALLLIAAATGLVWGVVLAWP